MKDLFTRLVASKAFWTAVGGILVAIGSFMAGAIDTQTLVASIFAGVSVIFLRDGSAKNAEAIKNVQTTATDTNEVLNQ